jgi:hypothetical protein
MSNHRHLLLWPECDGELATFMQRLTITHVRRWQQHRGYAGLGLERPIGRPVAREKLAAIKMPTLRKIA